ncbi:MAG TPA: tyrosine--tRNA ligase [Gemmatimonadales bacterium]|nr:tyrosine--tRNA ligase [Gemmatimonadales bacterium]
MTSTLLDELAWRGLLQDHTPGLPQRLARGAVTGYVGFDPTAASLQVGNLVPIMLLAHLQRAGGKPIVVVGGGTGLIGDPSGKSVERPLLSEQQIGLHAEQQRRQLGQFLEFGSGPRDAELVNNVEWLRPLGLLPFLRDVGKHFTLSHMLQKESVKQRLDAGISYTEFSYMLLQAYDFLHLFRTRRCELQMGGSDQWGNITAGIELIRRVEGGEAHGLSAPLVTTSSGAKFGKTEGQAVWLDDARTPPLEFYNFWVNVDDRDVDRYLRMFTFMTREAIDAVMAEHADDPGARIPHHALASAVTDLVRPGTADELRQALTEVFADPGTHDVDATIERLAGKLPANSYAWDRANPPKPEDLFLAAGLASSRGDARRLLKGKGLYLNRKVPAAGQPVSEQEVRLVAGGRYLLLQKGRKTYRPLRITGLE